MSLIDIFDDVKKSFHGIWQTKERGKSLEIITPYATTNNRFISVFLTKQDDNYIISDGGWIKSGIYDVIPGDDACFLKVFYHYQSSFNIKETSSKDGITYFYLKISNAIDIPSKIFDLAIFIQNIVSVSEIDFESKIEKETKALFVSKANEYLKSFVNADQIRFNKPLDPNRREIKFNAIYYKTNNDLTLLNYVTGSSWSYFSSSIFKANTLYEMAEETMYKDFIHDKITLVDTDAVGYVPNKIAHFLLHLENHTGSKIVEWNQREKLAVLLEQN
ncbi:hypothetical protein OGH69_09120 [Flavobacterium sp. MFBS3-15]|uniref:hypothetical protein n=1 Tax=Flavobacterium sp. MFBS3-15 TaxID=2989816 RepID=UPI002235D777|nr:hypothetical protein [Flavobacterium sp. MFBS3-15]MCW4469123.1 hypothetical protein [Flavobacterium sp. MFBS3-15]